jgi:guanosine-3',5'-bis(diphosphate) 3'-pyrophosphohydrolase
MFPTDLYVTALRFAAQAHGEQKTPHGYPYLVHVVTVASEVIGALQAEADRDAALAIPCALLHDVVEDTQTPVGEIEATFGSRVAAGVLALTKDARVPAAQRMRDSLDRILRQPVEIAMVKMCDRLANLGPPPPQWSEAKVAAYREEAGEILSALAPASSYLAARLANRIARYPDT